MPSGALSTGMRAFAPGSVTTVFAPPAGGSDRSRGASVAIADGVEVEVLAAAPGDAGTVTVDGETAPFEPVSVLLEDLGVDAAVDVRPEVPLGCGFGASGAATLATALAANERFGLGRARDELVAAAHAAELAAQTGMGDVFVQDRGGIVASAGAGLTRTGSDERLEYASFGSIDTSAVLADEATMARIRTAGERVLADLPAEPSLPALVARSWSFARETRLVTERVEREVERVRAAGGAATMAMLGETVVATGVEGVLDCETRVAAEGARLR